MSKSLSQVGTKKFSAESSRSVKLTALLFIRNSIWKARGLLTALLLINLTKLTALLYISPIELTALLYLSPIELTALLLISPIELTALLFIRNLFQKPQGLLS